VLVGIAGAGVFIGGRNDVGGLVRDGSGRVVDADVAGRVGAGGALVPEDVACWSRR